MTQAVSQPLTFARVATETRSVARLAWPQSLTQFTSFAPGLAVLAAVGHLEDGAVLVGAAGVASMYANMADRMMLFSTSMSATGLFSQAFGAGNHRLVGLFLLRVLLLHVAVAVCLSLPLTAIAGRLFAAFGLPSTITGHAQSFLWIRLLGVPGLILYFDLSTFLNAQGCVKLPMVIMCAGALSQMLLVFLLTTPSTLGFAGAPWALTIVELGQGVVLLAATPWRLRSQRLRSWPNWRRDAHESCRGWLEIVTRGWPACVMVISEWGGWECTLFIASALCASPPHASDGPGGCPAIEAIPICTTVHVSQFLIAFGPGLAANVRVGNLLGEGRPSDARFCGKVAYALALAVQLALTTAILSQRDLVASAFVDDTEVHAHIVQLMPYTTAYSFLSTSVSGFSQQLLFGVGARLFIPAVLNLVAFFIIGLPLGALLGLKGGLEERGIWLGLIIAMLLALVGQFTYLALAVDWEAAAESAREKAFVVDENASISTAVPVSDSLGVAAPDSDSEKSMEATVFLPQWSGSYVPQG